MVSQPLTQRQYSIICHSSYILESQALYTLGPTSGNSQNTNFTIYVLFPTISNYFQLFLLFLLIPLFIEVKQMTKSVTDRFSFSYLIYG